MGQSLQGRVRFLLRVRLQHGNCLDCSSGAFSARRWGLGIFALAALMLQVAWASILPPSFTSQNERATCRRRPWVIQTSPLPGLAFETWESCVILPTLYSREIRAGDSRAGRRSFATRFLLLLEGWSRSGMTAYIGNYPWTSAGGDARTTAGREAGATFQITQSR